MGRPRLDQNDNKEGYERNLTRLAELVGVLSVRRLELTNLDEERRALESACRIFEGKERQRARMKNRAPDDYTYRRNKEIAAGVARDPKYRGIRVEIDGVVYKSLQAASKALNMSVYTVQTHIIDENKPNWRLYGDNSTTQA